MRRSLVLVSALLLLATAFAGRSSVGAQTSGFPNDPLFARQWNLHNTGQNGGTPGADIHALEAWGLTRCSPDVMIAMLDTGVDPNQPDLAGKLVPGAAFVSGVSSTADDNGHGTGTAGIVAANTDNGTGIAAVCPLGKIMPVKVADAAGHTDDPLVAKGIRWAVNHGARVINLSLGTDNIPAMRDAIAYAYNHGVVVVAATPGGDTYPADYPHVIAVAGSDKKDHPVSQNASASKDLVLAPSDVVYTTGTGGTYAPFCNCVSIAAPQVAGVAALLVSLRPDLTVDQVVQAVEQGADFVPGQSTFNAVDGWGRVNAYRSLQIAQGMPRGTPLETPGPTDTPEPTATSLPQLTARVWLAARSLHPGQKQTIRVNTLWAAEVAAKITYASKKSKTSIGEANGAGQWKHTWRVPAIRGKVKVAVTVSHGGTTVHAAAVFTIR